MAIVTCPDCGREISDSAIICPNCGYPYQKNSELYLQARRLMNEAKSEDAMLGVAEMFDSIKGFRDADVLKKHCKSKSKELPNIKNVVIKKQPQKKGYKSPSIYAILLTLAGGIIVWASNADNYFNWSFANSSLSGGTRYYDSSFPNLLTNIPAGNLIIITLLASIAICIVLAWIVLIKNKRLELYCVIASSVTLALILICSIIGPPSFTDHNDFGFGFYSYQDFEGFGKTFYIHVGASVFFLAVSIISRIKSIAR